MSKGFGEDARKWVITKTRSANGRWDIWPPVNTDDPAWYTRGGVFDTGAEAFAAFAAGVRDA